MLHGLRLYLTSLVLHDIDIPRSKGLSRRKDRVKAKRLKGSAKCPSTSQCPPSSSSTSLCPPSSSSTSLCPPSSSASLCPPSSSASQCPPSCSASQCPPSCSASQCPPSSSSTSQCPPSSSSTSQCPPSSSFTSQSSSSSTSQCPPSSSSTSLYPPSSSPTSTLCISHSPQTVAILNDALVLPSTRWVNVTTQPLSNITLCKVSSQASSSRTPAVVTHSVTIMSDLTWQVHVHNHFVDPHSAKIDTCLEGTPRPSAYT